jgi:hypothetical protein
VTDETHPVTAQTVVGHPKHTGRFWFDFAAACAAIFISVVSLVVAIDGEHTQRELLAANAWPFLQVEEDRSRSNGTDVIMVRNEGVGPARVFSFEVFYHGRPVRSAPDLLAHCCGLSTDPVTARGELHELSTGDVVANVIRPSDARTMIRITAGGAGSAIFNRFDGALEGIGFRACYCSILDRCWVSDLKDLLPRQVVRCPMPAQSYAGAGL